MGKVMLKVSVIIPVFNARANLEKCIESVSALDYPDYEIIFVDDGSTDGSEKIIKSYQENNEKITLLQQENKGPSTARNLGVKYAKGDVIIFTDSDCIVPANWIKSLLEKFQNNIKVVGGGIQPASQNNLSEVFEQYRREKLYRNEERLLNALPSCNLAIEKKVFYEVGGFDESFKYASNEDYDLCYRIADRGYDILYSPSVSIIHCHAQSWVQIFKRAYIHGKEGVKLRAKRGMALSREIFSLILQVIKIPFSFFVKYPFKLWLGGVCYEIVARFGICVGIFKYRF